MSCASSSQVRNLFRRKSLSMRCRFLTLIASAAALRKQHLLSSLFGSARAYRIPRAKIVECLLQSYLFAGYPATIEALIVFRKFFPDFTPKKTTTPDSSRLRFLGERVCRIIYRGQYEKLLGNVRALHPELADWMLLEGYGKVLSRSALPLRVRELINVAILASGGWERQLFSHIRGAFHAGASGRQVREVINQLQSVVSENRLKRARAVFGRVLEIQAKRT